jgi:hypothetical protein
MSNLIMQPMTVADFAAMFARVTEKWKQGQSYESIAGHELDAQAAQLSLRLGQELKAGSTYALSLAYDGTLTPELLGKMRPMVEQIQQTTGIRFIVFSKDYAPLTEMGTLDTARDLLREAMALLDGVSLIEDWETRAARLKQLVSESKLLP